MTAPLVVAGILVFLVLMASVLRYAQRKNSSTLPAHVAKVGNDSLGIDSPENLAFSIFQLEQPNQSEPSNPFPPIVSDALRHALPVGLKLAEGQSYRMVVSASTAALVDKGKLHFLRSKEVHGGIRAAVSDGKSIRGNASLVTQGKGTLTAMAGFQLLSFAVGQAHMSEINSRLNGLDEKLDEVLARLDHQKAAKISVNFRHLESRLRLLESGKLSQVEAIAFRSSLEAIELELKKVVEEDQLSLRRLSTRVAALEVNKSFSSIDNGHRQLRELASQYKAFAGSLNAALMVRGLGLKVQFQMPDTSATLEHSLSELAEEISMGKELASQLQKQLCAKARELSGSLTSEKRTIELRYDIIKFVEETHNDFQQSVAGAERLADQAYLRRETIVKQLRVEGMVIDLVVRDGTPVFSLPPWSHKLLAGE